MRWLFILLLAANAAYAGWRLNKEIYAPPPATEEPAIPPLPPGIPQLRLLTELDRQPKERTDEPPDTGQPTAATAGEAAVPVATPEAAWRAGASGESKSKVRDDVPAPTPRCVTIGPFVSRPAMAEVSAKLAQLASQTRSRSDTAQETKLFQVFLEPTESEADAQRRLEELKSKGIQDYLLIRKGEMRNAIQVGVFRSQESVARRLSELESRGYKPIVVPKYEGRQRFWIDVVMDSQAMPEGIETRVPKNVKITAVSCDKIADAKAGQ
ncbi:MAG: SPOR domain-containing protein [Chromatiales bacterium]